MSAKRLKLDSQGVPELIKDKETEGFDLEAGETWVFPTNYSIRDYQYNIIQEALLKNTMVSLPTGLGKTFIAAVVMYNFYRWYPTGKIIFMAPTKPLVKQQVEACYNIMAIPKEVTAELTGTKVQEARKNVWNEKRVFFITPQVLQNDLNVLTQLGPRIKCLVVDEAHKAKRNHAYCEVVRKLKGQNSFFRVLALSATPGNTPDDVTEVIENLLIAHLEFRTDESPDVVPYIFQRSLETVVVQLDDFLIKVRDDYIVLLEKYTRVLMKNKILMGNCSNLTKGKIFMTMKNYQETNRQNRDPNYNEIMKYLNICHTLYYAFELLLRHGLRSFLLFFQDRVEKSMLCDNAVLHNIIQNVQIHMGPLLNIQTLPDGSITGIPDTVKFGHPKFYKLRDIACAHFEQENNSETRVIVFCEFRETVIEAYAILSLSQPLIKPRIFMGKSSITQREQLSVIKSFREGSCNTLISTCIGEEGIDVGNVDLIICFDINNKSPIRMIQRMGRTGRKRQGRVVILVTEGKEQQTLKECLVQKQSLSHHILQAKAFEKDMYKENPRMIPDHIVPKCNKIFITVKKQENNQKGPKSKSKNLKDIFKAIAEENRVVLDSNSESSLIEAKDRIPLKESYWDKSVDVIESKRSQEGINFSDKISKLRTAQPVGFVGHSSNTNLLVLLLQSCESKKFNLPTTQTPAFFSQKLSQKPGPSTNTLKQRDIRHMFTKPNSSEDIVFSASQRTSTKEQEYQTINSSIAKIANCLNVVETNYNSCNLCTNLFDCSQYCATYTLDLNVNTWIEPDSSIYDGITEENLRIFEQSLISDSAIVKTKDVDTQIVYAENVHEDKKIKLDDALESSKYIESPFKAPKSVQTVLKKCNLFDSPLPSLPFTQIELQNSIKNKEKTDENIFSLDVHEFDKAEFTQFKTDVKNDFEETLNFFNCTDLEEIFEHSFNSASQKSDATILYSPEREKYEPESKSPILSFNKNRSSQARRKTISFSSDEQGDVVNTSRSSIVLSKKISFSDIADVADLSVFGLNDAETNKTTENPPPNAETSVNTVNVRHSLNDICDQSFFDLFFDSFSVQNSESNNRNDCEKPLTQESPKHIVCAKVDSKPETDDKEWESGICNFRVDSSEKKEHADNTVDIVDLTSDNSLSSPSKSPSLLKSQKQKTQKSPLINHRINFENDFYDPDDPLRSPTLKSQRKTIKRMPRSILTLKKTTRTTECVVIAKPNAVVPTPLEPKPTVQNRSPTLSKREATDLKRPVRQLNFSDDDDDFEDDSKPNVSWIRPKAKILSCHKQAKKVNKERSETAKPKKSSKHNVEDCPYVNLEAEVTDSDSESAEGSFLDGSFDKSFVDDDTENFLNTTVMHAQYLESVKDTNRGQFKIPQRPISNVNVFSQVESVEDNSYLNDTFCVNSQDVEPDNTHDLSELEIAEMILKRKKKKARGPSLIKRRRIVKIGSSSDSD